MASLYDIDRAILECVDLDTGEIIDAEKLDALQMERSAKIESVALWYKNLLSDAAQYKAEKDAFAEKERAATAKAERLKQYLTDALQGEKYKSTRVNISYRKSERVIVENVYSLPTQFVKFSEPTPDKTALKNAIKNGEEVYGAYIDLVQSTIIK